MEAVGGAQCAASSRMKENLACGVPGFDDNVVEFVAQKVLDDALEAGFDFEKIGEHADGREAALHHSRLKEATNRFGGVSMLRDHRFERAFPAESRGEFGAKLVEMSLSLGLVEALGFDEAAKLADFFRNPGDALGHGFEFEGELSTLAAERFHLKISVGDFGLQTLSFAIRSGEALFGLS
jgi:hypothetical protein